MGLQNDDIDKIVLQRFLRILRNNRLANAYLFNGPQGIGKIATALAVAKLINCQDFLSGQTQEACKICESCQKIEHSVHPDVWIIEAQDDNPSIRITQIRELISRLQMRAFMASKKVCIIKNIEQLSDEAASALLKTLEEPPQDSVMILTAQGSQSLLPTIVSRCQQVNFYPNSLQVLKSKLQASGMRAQEAQGLAFFAQGCPGLAQEWQANKFWEQKNEIIDNLVLQANNEPYLKKILSNKEQLKEALTVAFFWFRDILILKTKGTRDQLANPDRYDELSKLEIKYSIEKINRLIDGTVEALNLLSQNLNIRIPLILLRETIWAG